MEKTDIVNHIVNNYTLKDLSGMSHELVNSDSFGEHSAFRNIASFVYDKPRYQTSLLEIISLSPFISLAILKKLSKFECNLRDMHNKELAKERRWLPDNEIAYKDGVEDALCDVKLNFSNL